MVTNLAKDNLEKDRNVQGKEWLATYRNYFSDKENIRSFIEALKPHSPGGELDILYVASASGLLGERLIDALGKGKLTLVDISSKHLRENKNPMTKKICADLLEMDLCKKFDLVMMRSSLDYFPSMALQIQVLKVIRDHLKPEGLFVNQPAYLGSIEERKTMSNLYNSLNKVGNRFFQSTDLSEIYAAAGFTKPEKIGEGKVMNLTEQDHIKRYEFSDDDVKTIQGLIKGGMKSARVTKTGYNLRFEFPIFLSRPI